MFVNNDNKIVDEFDVLESSIKQASIKQIRVEKKDNSENINIATLFPIICGERSHYEFIPENENKNRFIKLFFEFKLEYYNCDEDINELFEKFTIFLSKEYPEIRNPKWVLSKEYELGFHMPATTCRFTCWNYKIEYSMLQLLIVRFVQYCKDITIYNSICCEEYNLNKYKHDNGEFIEDVLAIIVFVRKLRIKCVSEMNWKLEPIGNEGVIDINPDHYILQIVDSCNNT